MVSLLVLRTKVNEKKLFLMLIFRGRHAEIPRYLSVDSDNWNMGWVIFTYLDRAPSIRTKVVVAGNVLLVNPDYESEVKSWLREWNIKFTVGKVHDFKTKALTRNFVRNLRKAVPYAKKRAKIGKKIAEERKKWAEQQDRELLGILKS